MVMVPSKCCRKCQGTYPATLEFFYRNAGGKYGVTPRCKSCVSEDNAQSHARRMAKDPKRIREQANARTKKHYRKNLESSRARHRDAAQKARQDPIKAARIQARKRGGGAGLTPEEIEAIRNKQRNLCLICEAPDPSDLDHCHSTGKVRFLLCNHCNRGLGAFKDNPFLMRKAAEILEKFYGH